MKGSGLGLTYESKLGGSESRTGPAIWEGLRGVLDELATQEYRPVIHSQGLRLGERESPLAGFLILSLVQRFHRLESSRLLDIVDVVG